MSALRVAFRLTAALAVTGLAGLVPVLVRLATLGAEGPAVRVGARAQQAWGRSVCALFGVRIEVDGAPGRPPFVVAANHLGYLDILVLAALYPSVFLSRVQVAGWPLFGPIARAGGTVFVDKGRLKDVVRAGDGLARRLRSGMSVTLFPEGRTGPGAELRPFLPSLLEPAAREQVPCWAASLTYETPGVPDPPAETVCWYDGAPFLPHIRRFLKIRRTIARVRFAPRPVASSDRKELARLLRDEVLARWTPVRQEPAA